MLDDVTKKRINSLRDILVGKVPDPKSQIEQITNALIYKFMNDMDNKSVKLGGKESFFSGKYKKYSWDNLMDNKTSGIERVKLYSESLDQLYYNENIPQLFRDIFKNSSLPFKDPSTLNMFLKEINNFEYTNSEKIGDAYEYLLSFMGSQGDAGQFRTPRNIIDFLVELIKPKKNESILDPSCGTSGFLISSYKYLINENTKSKEGDLLNSSERKKIANNLNGYDISPDMVKMSLTNMFLHNFKNPKIFEYDCLSDETKWNEYYDVILANPPFFTPRGGITPHKRFGVSSRKAEVLFIDYIYEHLKPDGRAAIIVPDGILFIDHKGHKQIRQNLIKKYLIGVISLPRGIFLPYSGSKTSILLLDKKLSKDLKEIFFCKVSNDGFELNNSRSPIDKNDLPDIKKTIENFLLNKKKSKNLITLNKETILNKPKIPFVLNRYLDLVERNRKDKKGKLVKLKDIVKISRGSSPRPIKKYVNNKGDLNWIKIGDTKPNDKYITKSKEKITKEGAKKSRFVDVGDFILSNSMSYGRPYISKIQGYIHDGWLLIKNNKSLIDEDFLFYLLSSKMVFDQFKKLGIGTTVDNLNKELVSNVEIPLIDISEQKIIVKDLNVFQTIVDGCEQILNNFKPSIEINPDWKMIDIENVAKFKRGPFGGSLKKEIFKKSGYLIYEQNHAINDDYSFERYYIDENKFNEMKSFQVFEDDLIISCSGTMGRISKIPKNYKKGIINQALLKLTPIKDKVLPDFLKLYLESLTIQNRYFHDQNATVVENVSSVKNLKKIPFPDISLEEQKKLINKTKDEINLINKNKEIKKLYKDKINYVIEKIA